MHKKVARYVSELILLVFTFVSIISQPAYALTRQNKTALNNTSQNTSQAKVYRQKGAKRLTEMVQKRDQHTKYYLNSDGTTTAEISINSRHYKDKNGKWQDISNKIVPSKESGFGFSNEVNSFKTHFAKSSASRYLAMLKLDDNQSISWNMANANAVTSVTDTYSVTYPGILSNADLRYETFSDGLKENIILKSPDVSNSFKFNFTANGLTPEAMDGGSIVLKDDKSDEIKLVLQKPYIFDSKNVSSQDVDMDIEKTKSPNVFTITVTADSAWLNDPARVYPCTIDPTITTYNTAFQVSSGGIDTYIAEGAPDTSYYINSYMTTGFDNGSNYLQRTKSLVKFAPNIPSGAIVTDAVLSLYKYTTTASSETLVARRITSGWASDVRWSKQPDVDSTYTETQASLADVSGDHIGWVNFNVWSIVKGWINGGLPNYGFMIQHNSEYDPLFFYYSSESPVERGPLLSLTYITDEIGLNPYWSYANTEAGSVNTFNGNFITSALDFSLPGRGIPISITRTYNSRGSLDGIFGQKWFSNLDMQLVLKSWGAVLIDSAGTERPFMLKSDGTTYTAPDNYPVKLYKDTDGGVTVYRMQEAVEETDEYQSMLPALTFDSGGKLTQLSDGKGNVTTISRGTNSITITDPSGRTATIKLNADGTANEITTSAEPGKVKASYAYSGGCLTSVAYDNSPHADTTINYEWNGSRLSSLTDKNGSKRYINYNAGNQVVSIGTLNMLSNPSLEASPDNVLMDNWTSTVSNDNGSVKQNTTAKYGKYGLNITSIDKPGATGMSYLYGCQEVAVKPGTEYSFSAYIKTNNLSGNAFLNVQQLDASGSQIS